jgi:hypothetical protein
MNSNSVKFSKYAQILGTICGSLAISLPLTLQAIAQTPSARQTTSALNPCPGIYYEEPYNTRLTSPQNCPPNAYTLRQLNQGFIPGSPTSEIPSSEQTRLGVGGEDPTLNPNPQTFSDNRSQRTTPPGGSVLPPPSTPETDGQTTVPTSPPGTRTQTPTQRPTTRPGTGRPTVPPTVPPTTPPGGGRPSVPPPRQIQPLPPRSETPTPTQTQTLVPSTSIALRDGRVNVRLVNDTGARISYQVIGDTAQRSLKDRGEARLEGLNAPATLTFQRDDGGLVKVTPRPSRERGTLDVTLQGTDDTNQDRKALRIQENGTVYLN